MEEDGQRLYSESPLFSDYDSLSIFLRKASFLAEEANNFNVLVLREYFSVLKELYRLLRPLVLKDKDVWDLKLKKLDKSIIFNLNLLASDKNFKVPVSLFEDLDEFHNEILDLKQNILGIGFQVRPHLTGKKKLARSLGVDFEDDED